MPITCVAHRYTLVKYEIRRKVRWKFKFKYKCVYYSDHDLIEKHSYKTYPWFELTIVWYIYLPQSLLSYWEIIKKIILLCKYFFV